MRRGSAIHALALTLERTRHEEGPEFAVDIRELQAAAQLADRLSRRAIGLAQHEERLAIQRSGGHLAYATQQWHSEEGSRLILMPHAGVELRDQQGESDPHDQTRHQAHEHVPG